MQQALKVNTIDAGDAKAVRFDIGTQSAVLGAHDVDALIQWLATHRAAMSPPPPMEPQASQQYVVEMDPCWYVDKNPMVDGVVLLMRHTGYGWTGFSLPQASLERLQAAFNHPQPPLALPMSQLAS